MNKFITFSLLIASLIIFATGMFFRNNNALIGSASAFLCITSTFLLNSKLKFFTSRIYLSVILFAATALLGGKALNMYSYIPYFDKLLHFTSGIIIASVGKSICKEQKLSGVFSYVFIFSFAVALAGIWEFFEFTMDSLFNMNCQNNSLKDTMFDMIAGSLGAIVSAVIKK